MTTHHQQQTSPADGTANLTTAAPTPQRVTESPPREDDIPAVEAYISSFTLWILSEISPEGRFRNGEFLMRYPNRRKSPLGSLRYDLRRSTWIADDGTDGTGLCSLYAYRNRLTLEMAAQILTRLVTFWDEGLRSLLAVPEKRQRLINSWLDHASQDDIQDFLRALRQEAAKSAKQAENPKG